MNPSSEHTAQRTGDRDAAASLSLFDSPRALAAALAALTLGGAAALSPPALLTFLVDAPWALAALLPGLALGFPLVRFLRLANVSRSWHFLLSAGLGLGAWSTIILVLGLTGWLERRLFVGIVAAAAVHLMLRTPGRRREGAVPPRAEGAGRLAWLWLAAAPFLSLAITAAAHAPGLLWKEEGYGYDVLEYHLQLPREYLEEGRISYRPHNIYGNFPANVEMLYLAAMVLTGSPQDTGTIAQLIHLLLGALTVVAVARAGAEWSPRGGVVAGVAAATAGWMPYLSGLAYVELGMLFFAATATACVLRVRGSHEATKPRSHEGTWGWVAAAGLLAGWACGCKYTAAPLVALPLGCALLVVHPGRWAERTKAAAWFAGACALAFSPWLAKNAVLTGNPVFPLAQRLFAAEPEGWGSEETARWDRGHAPRADKSAPGDRLRALWRNVPGDHHQRFGPLLFALAAYGAWRAVRRGEVGRIPHGHASVDHATRRMVVALVVMVVVQVALWTLATHLFARFAVVLLIPLAVLCGGAIASMRSGWGLRMLAVLMIAGAGWNLFFAGRLFARESAGAGPAEWFTEGRMPGYEYLGFVNRELPAEAKVLLVGEARAFYVRREVDYAVVFNRQPLAEAAAVGPEAVCRRLRARGYTHVVVHWMEIARLRRTYGFSQRVDEALFEALAACGVRRVREFSLEGFAGRYVSVYEVTGE